jgi:protein-tyrosine phosphatase
VSETPPPPIPNSYWLPGHRILAGEYPSEFNARAASKRIGALLDAGITCFLDLTHEHELEPYDLLLADEAAARGIRVSYIRLPIRDMRVSTPREMSTILDTIDSFVAEGGKVYVHCWGGVGRTGTVVGCHLVSKGMAPDDALAEVGRLFGTMSPAKLGLHPGGSPETEAQRAMIRGWGTDGKGPSGTPSPAR